MTSPQRIVALVGRPNVGKSRLFNRLARKRLAIVHDQPGVTRDVNATEIADGAYTLLDTGGIGLEPDMSHKEIVEAAEDQVFFALQSASLICLVVDGREGPGGLDETLATRLRTEGKRVLLVVNKIDSESMEPRVLDFAGLGFAEMLGVSAEHGYGIGALEKAILETLGPAPEPEPREPGHRRIRLAFVGRPNVGKSSLVNALLDTERLVVSEVAGTTRDSVALDLDFPVGKGSQEDGEEVWRFRLVDTAGVRRSTKLSSPVEYFSTVRSRQAAEVADVVFLVLDALDGVTRQDKSFLGEIVRESRAALAVLVNKWDLAMETFANQPLGGYKDEKAFRQAFTEAVHKELFYLPGSPVIFASATERHNLRGILETARMIDSRAEQHIPTPKINRLVGRLLEKRPPSYVKGKRLKVFYGVQTGVRPFRFRFFCNSALGINDTYRKYLENGFIDEFSLQGCPIRFEWIGKPKRYGKDVKR
jgi:GTPase